MSYKDIVGWSTLPEPYPYAAFNIDLTSFVEVGVAYGRSIVFLVDQLKLAGRENFVKVYAVDIWASQNQYNIFSANMIACGARHMVKPIRAYSHMASLGFADQSVDFVYLDGDHKFQNVKLDILSWYPKIKPGGFIAGHDFAAPQCGGVQKAVDEIIGAKHYEIWGKSWIHRLPT